MLNQQGDVLLLKINESEFPVDGKKSNTWYERGYVLAEGEATGHCHALSEVTGVEVVEKGEFFFIKILKEGVKIKHEEHNEQVISPGTYKVYKVREYDHFAEEARAVTD